MNRSDEQPDENRDGVPTLVPDVAPPGMGRASDPVKKRDQQSQYGRDGVGTLRPDAAQSGTPGPGVMIGGFQLQSLLGRGGMGEVWKAWDTKAERPVVLKLVPPELQRAGEEMARVKTTFQRVYALQHQHICPLYLLDEDTAFGWYLVMKYLDGQTLSAYQATYAARHGSFPVEQVVKVLHPVAEALDYAHAQRVIHRDIKPQNILVVGDGADVQVVDFGLAEEIRTTVSRYTQVQMDTSGTRPYMAPEQWKGQFQDARTDQYALAVVAYELLADRLPFESADFDILRACVLNDPPEQIERLPPAVNRALLLGLAKRREERFATCCALVDALAGSAGIESPRARLSREPADSHRLKAQREEREERLAHQRETSETPQRPSLPDIATDVAYYQYVGRKRGFLDNDPWDLRIPFPSHPDALIRDCQRMLGAEEFSEQEEGFVGGLLHDRRQAYQNRFLACLSALEKWAYFYPEYRGDFVNLWNQSAGVLKQQPVDASYFEQPGLKNKYPPPAHSGSVSVKERPNVATPPSVIAPSSAPEPTVGSGLHRAKKVVNAGIYQLKNVSTRSILVGSAVLGGLMASFFCFVLAAVFLVIVAAERQRAEEEMLSDKNRQAVQEMIKTGDFVGARIEAGKLVESSREPLLRIVDEAEQEARMKEVNK